jgi:hypothetical protein
MTGPRRSPPRTRAASRARLGIVAIAIGVVLLAVALLPGIVTLPPVTTPFVTPSGVPTPSATPTPTATTRPTPSIPPTTGGVPPNVPAFPTAHGYGRNAVGGRGGHVIYVTSLDDRGPGTLRAALQANGPRMILFRVGGTIQLRTNIDVTDPFVTIAGQTAPGDGIQVRGAMIRVMADQVVIRYLRMRPGDERSRENPADVDAITLNGANGRVQHVMLDHTTLLWGPDIGGISILGDVRDVTVQESIIGEGLYLSRHPEGVASTGHSMAANVTQLEPDLPFGRRITFFHNLFTTSNERMPRFQGTECADVVSNVIYDWGERAAYGNPRSVNLVANLFRAGPDTVGRRFWTSQHSDVAPRLFQNAVWVAANVADGFQVGGPAGDRSVFAAEPACPLSVEPEDARSLLDPLLDTVGANLPVRDAVDQRIVANVKELRGGFRNGIGQPGLHPDWPDLVSRDPPQDGDIDGMPDDWEEAAFGTLARGHALNSSDDADVDGWTDLEEYLNSTDPNRPDQPLQPTG